VIKLYGFSISELNCPLYFRAASRRCLINRGLRGSEKLSNLTWRRGKTVPLNLILRHYDTERQIKNVIRVRNMRERRLTYNVYTLIPLQFTERRTIWDKSHYTRTVSTFTYWNVDVKFKLSWLRNAWTLGAEKIIRRDLMGKKNKKGKKGKYYSPAYVVKKSASRNIHWGEG
jgi:hypothetical protein